MKNLKSFLSISFFLLSLSSYSQLSKGNLMVGGLFSTSIGNGVRNFNLNPSCGYFVKNNAVLGGALDFAYSRYSNGNYDTYMAISAMGRYFFTSKEVNSPKAPIFVQARLGFSTASYSNAIGFGAIGLGFDYFLTSSVALEGMVGTNIDNTGYANVYAMLGFQIFLPSSIYSKK